MLHVICDDGSTNVKLAWFEGDEFRSAISANSFRNGWKIEGMGSERVYNYALDGVRFAFDKVSSTAITTTNVDYQYSDLNLLAVHHALHTSGLEPQPVRLTVTLPLSEYYDADLQRDDVKIARKIKNLLRRLEINKGKAFTVSEVDVMPESLPAAFTSLSELNVGSLEKTLVVDVGGTTLDAGIIVGQFEDVSAIHGNPKLGVSLITSRVQSALASAGSEVSAYVASLVLRRRNDAEFIKSVVNDPARVDYVLKTVESEIHNLGSMVVNDLADFRDVNNVLLVGGGGTLVEKAFRETWTHLQPEKIIVLENPQEALARELARYRSKD
ncbi:plasmid segregation protein ParM domain-containing protein [Pantoea sp. A4]|uniref:plasmid segregation protein ParM domain-containing protein n=1 Tax=Pantoea sp. A4 TaxID=1225184 RepID=UPI000373C638|nr:plasmid segregation protein ParM domain-containing protein [Pantoea sp. A4]